MSKIYLAFLWHFHQPYYHDTLTGELLMPWVRLHGIKDYSGFLHLLDEFPHLKMNFNFVPCLLKQIELYTSDTAADHSLWISRKSVNELTESDKRYILSGFFMCHLANMISPQPRYNELYQKVYQRNKTMDELIKDFSAQDFLDLVVLSNLVWFHPFHMEKDEQLNGLKKKGRNYTEDDRSLILAKQIEILKTIIPGYRARQETGQVEITTTPFYHPILPLLCNMESAREAMPGVVLPEMDVRELADDARWQVYSAISAYENWFGKKPAGLWPAEGSVSPDILPLLKEASIKWFATDEEILAQTLKTGFPRDNYGHLINPQTLHQPYRVGDGLNAVFRDQYLSNLVSFQYQHWKPVEAAQNLIHRIKEAAHRNQNKEPFIAVILDGENPWEYYPDNGIEFLREAFRLLSDDKEIETVRINDYLEVHPPAESLSTIYSGSWINHNFAIWAGDEEDRIGWNYLARVRRLLKSHPDNAALWENIYIAEGSDWFWWLGPEHSSLQIEEFDAIFRKHLMNVYTRLGEESPPALLKSIKQLAKEKKYTLPWGFLSVKLDGRASDYFEWLPAGHYATTREMSAMNHSKTNIITDIFFGFDQETPSPTPSHREGVSQGNLCLRLDTHKPAGASFQATDSICINFLKPTTRKIIISGLDKSCPVFAVVQNSHLIADALTTVAVGRLIELTCPLKFLQIKENEMIEFFVELLKEGRVIERHPFNSPVHLVAPAHNFELINWQA